MDLAEVVRRHGPAYRERYGERMPKAHHAALRAIERCHTAACGGSKYLCTGCSERQFAWHRCGHRACGGCGQDQGQAWAQRQGDRLLPVPYYLVTFTVPEELRAWFHRLQGAAYDVLFAASAATLQEVAALERKRDGLAGTLGLLGVLHTWTRQLIYHPHIHYLVPGVALTGDGHLSYPRDPAFLLPVRKLSARFRRRMREGIEAVGKSEAGAEAPAVPRSAWREAWVVHIQPVGSGQKAVDYLAQYIHQTALSNKRLKWQDDERVCFGYRDRESGNERTVTLGAGEFLRRYLQHVLPKGYRRVRTYGWLSPAAKKRYEHLSALLGAREKPPREVRPRLTILRCPRCQAEMIRVGEISRAPP